MATKGTTTAEPVSTRFAVIATGGKQYKVSEGDVLKVEKLAGELKVGDTVSFDQVLLIDDGLKTQIGTPTVSGAIVQAVFKEHGRAQKINVVRYKQKSRYFKKNGHRQPFTKVEIKSL